MDGYIRSACAFYLGIDLFFFFSEPVRIRNFGSKLKRTRLFLEEANR